MITNELPGKQSVAETHSPGDVLGEHLTLKQNISSGDTGALWLAHDGESDTDISLLFLPGVLLADSRVMEELRAQVKLNRQLIHTHVLRTHDFIEEGGWAAISSDPGEAENLAALLAKKENGVFEPSEIQGWLSTTCQALDDAHRAGLLHRDLVPRNILLAKNGRILIANFGISRIILDALGRALGRGKIDEHLGSMSPQQLDGEYPARWDDIYALGALIYQLLTGKPPFYTGEIVAQVRKNVPSSISERRKELGVGREAIPDAWEKVVAACLDKHTPQRPKSAREVGIKLGAEISLAPPVVARPAATEFIEAKAPREETKKEDAPAPRESAVPSPAPTVPANTAKTEAREARENKESRVEDIVRKKPAQQAKPAAPAEAPPFKRLLETVPDERKETKGSPVLKIAVVVACVAGVIWVIYALGHNKPEPKQTTIASAASPTPVAPPAPAASPVEKPTPQTSGPEASPSPAAGTAKLGSLELARKNVQDMQNAVTEKTKARQQAESDSAAAKSALDAENKVLDEMKKSAADTEALKKQREDDAARAAADANKATEALKSAQKAADDAAVALAKATQANQEILDQAKKQDAARQAEAQKLDPLQKAATDKQAAADAAGNAEKDARAQLQAQQDLLKKAEAEAAAQPSPTPGAPEPAISLATPSGTADSMIPIAAKTPASGSIEGSEPQVLSTIQLHQSPTDVTPEPAATPSVPSTYVSNPNSQIDHTLVNSLGMRFQPVGNILFCIWLTRVQDFEVFAKDTRFRDTNWLQPGFKQGPDHPVVYINWYDATAFCKWLTDKEHKAGLLAANQVYRLPTDLEWSKAVGLPEESGKTPDERDVGIKDVYPWGTEWPPPDKAGNYDGEETDSEVSIKGYNDGYVYTSPVGSFNPNKYGLYDMGGNAWEWCSDWYNGEQKQKVLRGASWYNGDLQLSLLSSCRWPSPPDKSSDNFGFRCVIATEGAKPKK